ncbi:hypothetical protein TanjilG_23207 [Lupinus angustifolius]|uniref:Uncharacterized protein n=1 Tax=Lupinus angustifolius TaxID=3871 RepID=A0A1J7GV06_LUPAN|nr:hypothetical protein TanjilG_23207 [Lupinus angustifolius]
MHVYGEKPMTDPLQLVRFASFCYLCAIGLAFACFLPSALLETYHVVCCNVCKKPIKDSQYASHADQATAVGERRRAESMDNIDTAVSQSNLSGQIRVTSFSIEAKGKDLLEGTVLEHGSPDHKSIGLVHEQHVTSNDFPAPLATKIYYPQRSNRLRAAIRHLYFQDSSEDTAFSKFVLTPRFGSYSCKTLRSLLGYAGALPSGGLSNQFVVDNVSTSAATHVGLMRRNFLPKSSPFANNSGNPLGTMQQPNGNVPVI